MSGWHVVKVGGSLFDCPELPRRLQAWLNEFTDQRLALIAGGGELAEIVRGADARWKLGEEASHWLAIDAMRLAAKLLLGSLPQLRWIDSWQELQRCGESPPSAPPILFEVGQFLRDVEHRLMPPFLPRSWQVTSDSIAARVAAALGATHLTLLKSAPPPAASILLLEELGYVDPHFAIASAAIPHISFVNLRN
jgi:aspartokinase-like uncharacterized kinase